MSADSVSVSSLAGSWVSVRCETRPGPGFVLRHYQWSEVRPGQVSTVTGVLYHYADPACRQPLYSLVFRARLGQTRPSLVLPGELRQSQSQSWQPLSPGASQAWARLDQAWLRPHTQQSAARWASRISPDCPDLRTEAWKEATNYHVLSPTRNCLLSHRISLRELELFKITLTGADRRQLWLGDLASTPGGGERYRPTAYQSHPLLHYRPGQTQPEVARRVHQASPASPPSLRLREGPLGTFPTLLCS